MFRFILFYFWFLFLALSGNAQSTISIIPRPVEVKVTPNKSVRIDNKTILYYPPAYEPQALYLKNEIEKQTGVVLEIKKFQDALKAPARGILLQGEPVKFNKAEMYSLNVEVTAVLSRIVIKAKDIRGFINAFQTLLQLIPIKQQASFTIPAVSIMDYPQFSYRGMHLDVVRHIFPASYIKKYIDYLTFHKFNTFHWHLTDDQGWRFETTSYPKLNSIGSWRDSTLIGHFKTTPAKYDGKRYGGYYTKAEIKEVLEYAKVRGITVIPELDIPGHSRAAIAAYPQLSTKPDTVWNVATTWGMYNRQNNVLAPNNFTFQFLKDIFKELTDLFPSTYIHTGGDECSKLWWKQDATTQAFIKQNKLKDEVALQTYFIEYVARQLKQMNRKTVGWHEITEGDVDTSALIMNWADDAKALAAAKKGYSIIMTPGKPFYFDHYQSKDPNDSLAIHGYNPTEAVYNYQIVPDALKKAGLAHKIIGGQGNVWTEYMEWSAKVDYMIFPRMTALSENLWSKTKNYNDFLKRLEIIMIPRYQFWNSSYFKDFKSWGQEK
ncbi:MAG: beta-N-acetylhexosaminidase [Chitinophagaceae bacterium]|nr:beta-N-acetylhexosaminidase [Chitinophagaceae bacterium]